MNFILYYAAVSADAIFQAALVAAYGKHATVMRYNAFANFPEAVEVAKRQKLAADAAWLDYSFAHRCHPVTLTHGS